MSCGSNLSLCSLIHGDNNATNIHCSVICKCKQYSIKTNFIFSNKEKNIPDLL
jgi:hypothetical protein